MPSYSSSEKMVPQLYVNDYNNRSDKIKAKCFVYLCPPKSFMHLQEICQHLPQNYHITTKIKFQNVQESLQAQMFLEFS